MHTRTRRGQVKTVAREIVWSGHDKQFVEALIAELGILLDAEGATVSIVRIDRAAQTYVIDDRSIEVTLIAGPNSIQVRRKIVGAHRDALIYLNEQRALRVRLRC